MAHGRICTLIFARPGVPEFRRAMSNFNFARFFDNSLSEGDAATGSGRGAGVPESRCARSNLKLSRFHMSKGHGEAFV